MIFYWNQFSDETDVVLAERKIYSSASSSSGYRSRKSTGGGMRWRHKDRDTGAVSFVSDLPADHRHAGGKSVGQMLCDDYLACFANHSKDSNIRIVGHSLGTQVRTISSFLCLP